MLKFIYRPTTVNFLNQENSRKQRTQISLVKGWKINLATINLIPKIEPDNEYNFIGTQ